MKLKAKKTVCSRKGLTRVQSVHVLNYKIQHLEPNQETLLCFCFLKKIKIKINSFVNFV